MRKVTYQRFRDAITQVIRIGISTDVGEGKYGNRIDLCCSARAHEPSANCHHPDKSKAGGCDEPELTSFERFVSRSLSCNDSSGLGIALQPLQIGANVGGMLITKMAVFLKGLVDDRFELRWYIGVDPNRRHWWTLQNGV